MAQPRLLQQMSLMMGSWRHEPPEGSGTGVDGSTAWERRMFNFETACSVQRLYAASAGQYQPLLMQLLDFTDGLVNDLYDDLRKAKGTVAVAESKLAARGHAASARATPSAIEDRESTDGIPPRAQSAPTADDGETADKCDYAFSRVANAERRMARVVDEARTREDKMAARVEDLEREVASLEEQLQEQILKVRRAAKETDQDTKLTKEELAQERSLIDLQRALAREKATVAARDESIVGLKEKVSDLKELNGKYARQALELAARVRVYAEHNDKFATLLSLQHDEKLQTDKENELLRKELIDLNQFHQLRDNVEGEGGTISQMIDVRAIRHGRGTNAAIPRHLHYTGLMNRVSMAKEAAITMISDILTQRMSPANSRNDFPSFVHMYMTKRHEQHAIAWSYSLDEATRFYDADVNLNLFGLVSRRELPEVLYKDLQIDQQIFLSGCELMDAMQHGHPKLTCPVPHIVGFLVEMFPGYPDSAFRRVIEHLHSTLTSNGQAHYKMLFPNLERDELTGEVSGLASSDMRKENHFSQAFKELIVDDCAVSLQQLEDEAHRIPHDKISLTDIKDMVTRLYTLDTVAREVHAMVRRVCLDFLGSSGNYAVSIPKPIFIQLIRSRAPVRKGVFRLEGSFSTSSTRTKPLMSVAAGKGDTGQMVLKNLVTIDYRDVLQTVSLKRTSYITEEDIRAEEEERRKKELEAAENAVEEAEAAADQAAAAEVAAVAAAARTATPQSKPAPDESVETTTTAALPTATPPGTAPDARH